MISDEKSLKKALADSDAAPITDIQRYSVHDGPGIRTMVFFKGCPLRCQWCHNPETLNSMPELLYKEELCIGCGECLRRCPAGAVRVVDGKVKTDREVCRLCGMCAEYCYAGAREITGRYYTMDEVFEAVMKDMPFYERTGGGVTLSGGEVLMHAKFASRLLKKLKEQNVHTVIETCGYASWDNVRRVVQYTDLVLFDIKHCDEEEHKRFTGRSNQLILENLKKIAEMKKEIIARVPLIPGVNDSLEVLKGIVDIAKKAGVKELHILPFHQIGTSKWDAAEKDYHFRNVREPDKEEIDKLVKEIEGCGIPIVVGGN